MERAIGLEGFEAYGLDMDAPATLRYIADLIESGKVVDFAIVTLDEMDRKLKQGSTVLCRDEMIGDLMRAVAEEMNRFLCEPDSPEKRTTH